METISDNRCFGGRQLVLRHASRATGTDMTFGLFLPPEPAGAPVLWYLSGLTCTHENAMTKAGLQAHAAAAGLAVVFPDTSPRGEGVPDDDAYDMGQGAGFYVDATRAPWAEHFRMRSYVLEDLPDAVFGAHPLDRDAQAITGHSMGGHGALTLALTAPGRFRSVSAFAPICAPSASDWGREQLAAYTGDPAASDATELLKGGATLPPCRIDTGAADQFGNLLRTEDFAAAAIAARADVSVSLRPGYDHSYFFVSTFAGDHVAFHREHLG